MTARVDHCAPDSSIHHVVAIRLIDTRLASHRGHYVNHSVRGFRPPARWRISPPRFEPSRLRMRHIIRPQIILPAIQCNPDTTHSVAAMLCGAARPRDVFDTGLRTGQGPPRKPVLLGTRRYASSPNIWVLPWRPSRGRCSSSPAGGPLPPIVSSHAYVGTSAGRGPCSSRRAPPRF